VKRTDPVVLAELRTLAHGGKLEPVAVVEAARDEASPLHEHFEWDDTAAAHQHRLLQARKLISVHVEILPGATEASPVFVSLREDRLDGGYRTLISVMSDKDLRDKLLADAMADAEAFAVKYNSLRELADVFRSIRKARRRVCG
jgi:hypothetical protein